MAAKTLVQILANLEAKTEKTPEDLEAIEELKIKISDKDKSKETTNDFQDYQKFGELKFLQWNGDTNSFDIKQLRESATKEFEKFEKKFKDYPGKKPNDNKTVSLGLGITPIRLVKDYAVPESLYKMFEGEGLTEKYF